MKTNDLNLNGLPKELCFLLRLLENHRKGTTLDFLGKNKLDWDIFLKLVIHHRLFPGLSTIFKNMPASDIVPNSVINKLEKLNQSNTFNMLHLVAEMEELNQSFFEKKIPLLFLKGPILGKYLYGDTSLRTSGDLDLLVQIQQLNRVEDELIKMGYVKNEYIKTILNDWKWRHHHYTYFHPEKGVKVEVHWRLNPGPGKEPSFSQLWERKQEMTFVKVPINFLGNEDLFFFLVTHGARHGWSRLRWLKDIDQLLKKPVDWVRIKELFKKYSDLSLCEQAIILTNQLFKTTIPKATIFELGFTKKSWKLSVAALFYLRQMVNLHNKNIPKIISRYHSFYLTSIMSHRQKILFFLSCLFPYPKDAEIFPLPKSLHFLYFPLRPFIWTWRKLKIAQTEEVKG